MSQKNWGNISPVMTDEGNEKVQVTCYQCCMYHYHEVSTLALLHQVEDFT
jgi:hypothetical protein